MTYRSKCAAHRTRRRRRGIEPAKHVNVQPGEDVVGLMLEMKKTCCAGRKRPKRHVVIHLLEGEHLIEEEIEIKLLGGNMTLYLESYAHLFFDQFRTEFCSLRCPGEDR